ncbi:Reversion-inducing cysteine-rich protein with Kazal motifs [Nymphon striatum]|nr:Reversion-inducing cysteine-rich protein with Kazal motifs [Nymphon striatum]
MVANVIHSNFDLICDLYHLVTLFTFCRFIYIRVISLCFTASVSCSNLNTFCRDHVSFLKKIYLYCKWDLLGATMTKRWENRPCCSLPNSSKCRLSCLQAESRADISQGCRVTDEISFFKCLNRNDGEECCKNARTRDCYRQCRDTITSQKDRKKSQNTKPLVPDVTHTSPTAMESDGRLRNYLKYNNYPGQQARYLQACQMRSPQICIAAKKLETRQCQEACKISLSIHTDDQKIMEDLSSGPCGPPFPGNLLWQCFLANSEPHREEGEKVDLQKQALVLDNAKLLCCNKAASITCQDLCVKQMRITAQCTHSVRQDGRYNHVTFIATVCIGAKELGRYGFGRVTFSTDWNQNWKTFQKLCHYNHQEIKMLRCLADVDEPCQHGCTNLSYCSNFNNDGTELFRSCNAQSDMAAQKDVYMWQKQKLIRMPNIGIPVLDISTCMPHSWKAVACILHIKPCQRNIHSNFICRSDCLVLLRSCMDNKRLPFGHSPESLCHLISPPDGAPCISLKLYTGNEEIFSRRINHGKLYPCNHHNCTKSEVCVVNTDEASTSVHSSSHKCVPGCSLGEMSSLKVTAGTVVRIPLLPYKHGCHQLCECSRKGKIGKCHQSQFQEECNRCTCYAGHVICTKVKCPVRVQNQVMKIEEPGISCNCPAHYSPVCGRNGKTFPNGCIARHCYGMSRHHFVFGECYTINPCHPKNPCPLSHKCIPRRRSCLLDEVCPQYQCVIQKKNGKCSLRKKLMAMPVCDMNGKSHTNICDMLLSKQNLQYWRKCQPSCNRFSGLVCGVDGETYSNECAAKANYACVDYLGPCKDIGPLISFSTHRCSNVQCFTLKTQKGCKLVIPPGACCPICASVFRFLLNKQKLKALKSSLKPSRRITVQNMIERLHLQLKIIECDLYGYLDIYGDLIIIIKVNKDIDLNHYKRCQTEADRLSTYLGPKSPLFMSDGLLSTIEMTMHVEMVTTSGTVEAPRVYGKIVMVCFVLVMLL